MLKFSIPSNTNEPSYLPCQGQEGLLLPMLLVSTLPLRVEKSLQYKHCWDSWHANSNMGRSCMYALKTQLSRQCCHWLSLEIITYCRCRWICNEAIFWYLQFCQWRRVVGTLNWLWFVGCCLLARGEKILFFSTPDVIYMQLNAIFFETRACENCCLVKRVMSSSDWVLVRKRVSSRHPKS